MSLFFAGCELDSVFGPSKKEIELKQRELLLKEQELKFNQLLRQKELEQKHLLSTQQINAKTANDLAINTSKKEIELAKIKSVIDKEKIELKKHEIEAQNREKDLEYSLKKQEKDLAFDLTKQENNNTLSTQKYIIIIGSVLVIVFTFLLFTYYNNRRKDKLRAYEDNLDKYFREKENQAKIEIASKILDTIASGKLNEAQENKLISSLSGDSNTSKNTLLQENKHDNDNPKIEIIHDIDDTNLSSK